MPTCPECRTQLQGDDINVRDNVAFCRSCNSVLRLSDLAEHPTTSGIDVDPGKPPRGAWFHDDGLEVRVGGTTRSAAAFVLVPFMLVWSGVSLGGIYGNQILSGKFNPVLSLFGVPFLLVSIGLWGLALMTIWGRVEVAIRGTDGEVFTGVGRVGRRRRFSTSEFSSVREDKLAVHGPTLNGAQIVMEGRRRLTFGAQLSDERRYFVLRVMKSIIESGN